jgi:predicted permease
MTWSDLALRVRALLFPARVEQDLADEVDFHLAMARRKHAAAGHSGEEAERLARLDFGRVGLVKEDCRRVRGIPSLDTALQDIRYALRSFRRSPVFVFTVTATIALGLGINTALFTLFNGYVLRPIAVRDPYSLYGFTWTDRAGDGHLFSWPEYQQFEKDSPAFSEVAAVRYLFSRLDGRRFHGQLVTGNYFQMLGVGAALGRTLLPEDAAVPGRDPVLVLSYAAWRTLFGGRPDIIGTKIAIRGCPMQVIGVARQGFQDLSEVPRDFWAPLTMTTRLEGGPDVFGAEHPERLTIVGRIKRGQSTSRAEAALTAWSRRTTAQRPDGHRAIAAILRSKATAIPLTQELLFVFSPLAAAFALVLLLACANVANMMMARAMARQREIGIRLSLGAVRARLIRLLLTESVLLAVPAAIVGFAVSRITIQAGLRTMLATVPKDMIDMIPELPLAPDWRVLGFILAAGLASAFLFGLAPALQATRHDVMLAARGEFTADLGPVRVRNRLVIAQISICTLLLVACGILVRTTVAISTFDIGFHTHGVIAMSVVDSGRTRAIDTLASDAGVQTLAAASSIPMNGWVPSVTVSAGQNGSAISSSYNEVSPEFFGVLGIPITRGRNFTPEEAAADSPVAILSAAAAQRLFGYADSLGRVVHVSGTPARDVRVIGVAGDIVTCCIPFGKDAALLYRPTIPSAHRSLLVRVRGNAEVECRRLDAELARRAPGAVEEIHALDQYLAGGIYPFRAASLIAFAVGGLALLLTVSGIYGVLSYLVAQRTKEIGIRVALGATADAVIRLVLEQCLRLAAIGIGLGVFLALGLSRLIASEMVFLRAFDPAAFSAGVLLVACAALAAGYFPSRRAARIDPITTLRYD